MRIIFSGVFSATDLDVHSAFGAGDHDGRRGGPIKEDGNIKLFGDIDGFADKNLPDFFTLGSGLMGNKDLAKHLCGEVVRLQGSIAEVHAPFEPGREGSLAASSGMNLGFHDQLASAQS